MHSISDTTLLMVTNDTLKGLSRAQYEELLVNLGFASLDTLNEPSEYGRLTRRDLVIRTLQESDSSLNGRLHKLLQALHEQGAFSTETLRALAMDGIEFEHSIAGELAKPAEERSRLEMALRAQGMQQVLVFLSQSLENYAQGNYEAANAMSRTALEELIQQIASKISALRGNEAITQRGAHIGPVDYRNYLRTTGFLDNSEKEFLDKFYGYASTDGSHPGISSEAEARLRRFVVIGVALLFLEKLENTAFMNSLV